MIDNILHINGNILQGLGAEYPKTMSTPGGGIVVNNSTEEDRINYYMAQFSALSVGYAQNGIAPPQDLWQQIYKGYGEALIKELGLQIEAKEKGTTYQENRVYSVLIPKDGGGSVRIENLNEREYLELKQAVELYDQAYELAVNLPTQIPSWERFKNGEGLQVIAELKAMRANKLNEEAKAAAAGHGTTDPERIEAEEKAAKATEEAKQAEEAVKEEEEHRHDETDKKVEEIKTELEEEYVDEVIAEKQAEASQFKDDDKKAGSNKDDKKSSWGWFALLGLAAVGVGLIMSSKSNKKKKRRR